MRGCRQGDVSLPGEQPRGRVQADPPGSGDVDLGPGVQIGEVGGRTRRAVECFDVGGQLHQIAGDEAGGQAELPQDRHQQPRGVPAGPDPGLQRVAGGLHAGLHPDAVVHVLVDGVVESDQEVDGADLWGDGVVAHPGTHRLRRTGPLAVVVDRAQVGLQVLAQRLGIREREGLGELLDEEVERVDHFHIGNQSDGDAELPGRIGEHQAGQEIAERVLLPVHEVVGRFDRQRVGLDRRPGVRRRSQSDHMRVHRHESVEVVAGPMFQRHLDAHGAHTITPGGGAQCVGNGPAADKCV